MSTLCLNMIVKDESHVIRRCLEAALPLIDSWVIVDTGSTDGTQDLIREILAEVPGQLHERPWQDFGHNRTEAINLAADAADYLLFVDADDTLVVPDGYLLPELTADAYTCELRHGAITYRRTCVVRNDLGWRFEGVLHEYPTCGRDVVAEPLDLAIAFGADGARSQQDVAVKYAEDARILEAALVEHPDNARYAFYLAQSYRDSQQHDKALAAYLRRSQMGGFAEEVYCSLVAAARLAKALEHPVAEVIDLLLRAHDARPSRPEALGELARVCREAGGRWASALMFAERGLALPPNADLLFVEPDWRQWRLLDEQAIALYWLGSYEACRAVCDNLLDGGAVPADQVERVRANRQYALDKLDG